MANAIEDIKKLRELTGAGMMDAKAALEEAKGDLNKAQEVLRLKGMAKAEKKSTREASNGLIVSYVHGGKIGVLVEINCETDFVAKTEEFLSFANDVAMHVAATNPKYLDRDSVDKAELKAETDIIQKEVSASGKPAEHAGKIVEGKLNKWYEQVCLLDQPFIKNPDVSIGTLTKELVGKLGENIVISRFTRIEMGESE